MPIITDIKAREILDSRGIPTVEADVIIEGEVMGRAAVPSGASTGRYEAVELRDERNARFLGKGVLTAVQNIHTIIAPQLIGMDGEQQYQLDQRLREIDGSANKGNLGANALLAVSLACAKAMAAYYNMPLFRYLGGQNAYKLPMPMMNIINGGAHADNTIDIQEFMIVPISAQTIGQALQMASEIFHNLRIILKNKQYTTNVGDEGGFAPALKNSYEALDYIVQAIEKAGYRPGLDVSIALDVAATELLDKNNHYFFAGENKQRNTEEMAEFYGDLMKKYPVVSIEDGMGEDDWEGWKLLTQKFGKDTQLVGDDLFVTNKKRLKEGLSRNVANAILIKLNQIGTLSETLETIQTAQKFGYRSIISHRSGETEDTTIADLAVAVNAGQIKTGAPSRTDRICKYNQLLRISEVLGANAQLENPFS